MTELTETLVSVIVVGTLAITAGMIVLAAVTS